MSDAPDDARPTYVIWPDGYALIERAGERILIDATGDLVAPLGADVELGGGYVPVRSSVVVGGVAESCVIGGEGYFLTSGTTDA